MLKFLTRMLGVLAVAMLILQAPLTASAATPSPGKLGAVMLSGSAAASAAGYRSGLSSSPAQCGPSRSVPGGVECTVAYGPTSAAQLPAVPLSLTVAAAASASSAKTAFNAMATYMKSSQASNVISSSPSLLVYRANSGSMVIIMADTLKNGYIVSAGCTTKAKKPVESAVATCAKKLSAGQAARVK
jgi:hypothetical protein